MTSEGEHARRAEHVNVTMSEIAKTCAEVSTLWGPVAASLGVSQVRPCTGHARFVGSADER